MRLNIERQQQITILLFVVYNNLLNVKGNNYEKKKISKN